MSSRLSKCVGMMIRQGNVPMQFPMSPLEVGLRDKYRNFEIAVPRAADRCLAFSGEALVPHRVGVRSRAGDC
jgi:hypothetical protein